jgi:DNA-binding MarR family transcriptional regulator
MLSNDLCMTSHDPEPHAESQRDADEERSRLLEAIAVEGRHTSTRSVLLHAAVAEKLGLNPSDHKCADVIQFQDKPITAGRLAEITGLSTGAITGVLDRLERAGFITRDQDPNDRRRVVIRSTPERAPDLAPVFMPLRDAVIGFCDRYTNAELRVILDFMRGSEHVMRDQMARLQKLGPLPKRRPSGACRPASIPEVLVEAAKTSVRRVVSQVAAEVTAEVQAHIASEMQAAARRAAAAHAAARKPHARRNRRSEQ